MAKLKDKLIGFIAMLTQPNRKPFKRVHRLVVLPEFQSIGIGTRLLTEIGKKYKEKGWNVTITTSNPGLIHTLSTRSEWEITHKGHRTNWNLNCMSLNDSFSIRRYTMVFKMVK